MSADPAEAYERELEARLSPLDEPPGVKRIHQPCDHKEPCSGCGHYAEPDPEETA